MYIISPEFHRNLWSRFTWPRLLAMPLVLWLAYLVGSKYPSRSGDDRTIFASWIVYIFCGVVWGVFAASRAMREERNGKTWDFQKMSALGPSSLSFGKLFGATSYSWYFALPVMAYFCYASGVDNPVRVAIYMVLAGLIGQAVAFFFSIINSSTASFLLGVSAGMFVFLRLVGFVVNYRTTGIAFPNSTSAQLDVEWYGYVITQEAFLFYSVCFLLFWLYVGIYRLFREELLYRNTPVMWFLFVLSLALFFTGRLAFYNEELLTRLPIVGNPNLCPQCETWMQGLTWAVRMACCCFISMFVSYTVLVEEAHDIRKYKRLRYYLRRGRWRRVFENMPKWTMSALLVVIFAGLASYFLAKSPISGVTGTWLFVVLSFLLFVVRDAFVVHGIFCGRRGGSKMIFLAIYFSTVYVMLPLYFELFDLKRLTDALWGLVVNLDTGGEQFGMRWSFFYPSLLAKASNLLPVLLECFTAWAFMMARLSTLRDPEDYGRTEGELSGAAA